MKNILMAVVVMAGLFVNAGQDGEKWWVVDKTSNNQFVGFKVDKNGSAVLFENGTNVIERINKTNSNLNASSYTKDEIEKMFEVVWDAPEFAKLMDEKFEFTRIDNSSGMVVLIGKKFSDLFKKSNAH